MRHSIVVTVALVVTAAGCDPDGAAVELDGEVALTRLSPPSPRGGPSARERLVIRDPGAWSPALGPFDPGLRPSSAPPAIDFTRHDVILVAMGTRPSSGYEIEVEGVRVKDQRAWITVHEQRPGSGCNTLAVETSPIHIVIVPKLQDAVTFLERTNARECH